MGCAGCSINIGGSIQGARVLLGERTPRDRLGRGTIDAIGLGEGIYGAKGHLWEKGHLWGKPNPSDASRPFGQQRQIFPHHGRASERGDLRDVVGGRHFDEVHADKVQSA
jgi:hypothetical protein